MPAEVHGRDGLKPYPLTKNNQTSRDMRAELQHKIDRAIKLLRSIPLQEGEAVEVSYSGGKDSDVILQLTKEAGIKYRAIYKNTTIDPPGTVAHARAMGAEVLMPKHTFFELAAKNSLPSRWSRYCCRFLKEYAVLPRSIQGIRRSESTKRSERYKEPEECRNYGKGQKVRVYLPILDWADEDVTEFIADRGVQCHPLYYIDGVFHAERRLGCMGCPLASKRKRLEQFKEHPNLVKAYVRSAQKYINTHPDGKTAQKFKDGYELFVFSAFYEHRYDNFMLAMSGVVGGGNCKTLLEDYFGIKFNESTML